VGLDGGQIGSTCDNTEDYNQWIWKKHSSTVSISTGTHTFQIRRRETDYCIDRIILTTDSEYTPSGNGPAESTGGPGKTIAPFTESVKSKVIVPDNFAISVYPNPFNPSTHIFYNLPAEGHINLSIYDISGRKITELFNGYHAAGEYTHSWEATDAKGRQLTSGVYLLYVHAGEYRQTVKMIYVR
jgi:hypothetical protein